MKLPKSGLICLYICNFFIRAFGQGGTYYNDGPYIDLVGDTLKIRWVESGFPRDTAIHVLTATTFDRPNLPKVDLFDLNFSNNVNWKFKDAKKIIALSDLHGQYDIFIALLKAHKVIDEALNWNFGTHDLVITGDHFSRGDKVMEILWFLFKLEKQAIKANGRVHVMLGNHELMTLQNDLRYLNVKYAYTAGALKTIYPDLFSPKSILGNWLRKKNVITSINDILFVHAGISQKAVEMKLSPKEINRIFRDSILVKPAKEIFESESLSFLLNEEGPLWYRGYADTTAFKRDSIEKILKFYGAKSIVVGHTSMDEIISAFDAKLLFIDCSIKLGKTGQLLIWEKGQFFRGTMDGDKKQLSKFSSGENVSLFDLIADLQTKNKIPEIILKCDISKLIKNSMKEELQDVSFELNSNGDAIINVGAKIRSRGNMRKQVCRLPPVKIDFKKKDMKKFNLAASDELKVVLPCNKDDFNQEKLYQEYFLYQLYSIIDPNHIRTMMVNTKILDKKDKEVFDFKALIVEDEASYSQRTGAKVLKGPGKIVSSGLERAAFLRMYFFQYMIGNTDWSVGNSHNLMLAKLPENERMTAIPYDFDYSGFVNQRYAVPHESLPIKGVRERYLMPYEISTDEFHNMVDLYKSMENDILAFCEKSEYLSPEVISNNKKYLTAFFKELKTPKGLIKDAKIK